MEDKIKKKNKILESQEFMIFIFIIVVSIVFAVISDNFSSPSNIQLIFSQVAINGICTIGVSMVVFLGGIDLSSG